MRANGIAARIGKGIFFFFFFFFLNPITLKIWIRSQVNLFLCFFNFFLIFLIFILFFSMELSGMNERIFFFFFFFFKKKFIL